jgi:glutamine synthetase
LKQLRYRVPTADRNEEGLKKILAAHPEIRYVSLSGVDLGANDTDEKIPVQHFVKNITEYLSGGVQTDGSSVVLPGIATLNDGKVDLIADPSANWIVDYNYEFMDPETERPLGTLRIPSFLKHRDRLVDSRAVLKAAKERVERRLVELLHQHPALAAELGIPPDEICEVRLLAATELEFWVRTPGRTVEAEKLSVSQTLQESYWKRTKGSVRSALEHSLLLLEEYGLAPEMGHKEVGGVKATVSGQGRFDDVMEQLEVDWKYAQALQTADNELLARIMIKEVFRRHGLEVTFMAKPIEGVAGSGEHTHISIMVELKDGSLRNIFAPRDPQKDFLSPLGWGALMGLLRNYEAVGSFVTATNDALNRLKPGFEAPVCIVASIGHNVSVPSRNRTVLAGLIRDQQNPLATRFEVRAPNPHTNTYLALAAFYQAMLDGMTYAAGSGKSAKELEQDFCKVPGTPHSYLEKERAYRSEEDVFEHYSEEERRRLFGVPPATVWEAMENLDRHPEKTAVLTQDNVLSPDIVEAYRIAMLTRWKMELVNRIIPDNMEFVRACTRTHDDTNELDVQRWGEIQVLRHRLMRDDLHQKSVFSRIREAIAKQDFPAASTLQLEMNQLTRSLRELYLQYRRNLAT